MNEEAYAFLIVGPASSGTRFVTRCFIESGCLGNAGFDQEFDVQLPPPSKHIVWKTHNACALRESQKVKTLPLIQMVCEALEAEYIPVIIVVLRDLHSIAASAFARGYAGTFNELYKHSILVYEKIFSDLRQLSCDKHILSYDYLSVSPKDVLRELGKKIDFNFSQHIYAVDENKKHYRDKPMITDSRGYSLQPVIKSGIPFWVREGTVDINVLDEVIEGDSYQLNKIHLRKNPNIIDVGGHIGAFTKFAAWKWPHGNFYIYEANPRNWEILERNLQDIRHRTVIYHGALVGQEPVNKRIVINALEADRVTGGWGIIYTDKAYTPGAGEAVEVIENFYKLDTLLPILDKVDILKLDCEGSEFSILQNLTEAQLYQVDYLVAEIHCGALQHCPWTYEQFREKVLKQFICPQLEIKAHCSPSDLFNIVACNKKLIPKS